MTNLTLALFVSKVSWVKRSIGRGWRSIGRGGRAALPEVIAALGLGAILKGIALVSVPAAWIVGGAVLVAVGVNLTGGKRREE